MSDATSRGKRPFLIYFGHDARETTIQKRIAALESAGCKVTAFTFQRRHQAERSSVPFDNVPLGMTVDRDYLRRVPVLGFGILSALRRRRVIRQAEIILCRNIDMLLVALAAKLLSGSRSRVVYEVLDIQRAMVGKGLAGSLLRAAERWLLREIDLLVVSSPDFVNEYFKPVQDYHGPWYLLENKISGPQMRASPAAFAERDFPLPAAPPWIIGWFGVLRCARSLDLLAAIADQLGPAVIIHIRGRLSRRDISDERFRAVIENRPNMVFSGPYLAPDDLAKIYGNVHFSWSIDYTDQGANSDWLLPNRIYEGGYFNVIALAREGTATGRLVESAGLGWVLPEPIAPSATALLRSLDNAKFLARREQIVAKPRPMFVDETDTLGFLQAILDRNLAAKPASQRGEHV